MAADALKFTNCSDKGLRAADGVTGFPHEGNCKNMAKNHGKCLYYLATGPLVERDGVRLTGKDERMGSKKTRKLNAGSNISDRTDADYTDDKMEEGGRNAWTNFIAILGAACYLDSP
jgi:hypothetical protein